VYKRKAGGKRVLQGRVQFKKVAGRETLGEGKRSGGIPPRAILKKKKDRKLGKRSVGDRTRKKSGRLLKILGGKMRRETGKSALGVLGRSRESRGNTQITEKEKNNKSFREGRWPKGNVPKTP